MLPAEVLQKAIQDLRIVTGTPPTDGSAPTTREPNATENHEVEMDITDVKEEYPVRYKFLELFAGYGGFTGAVREACGLRVEVMDEQDQWTTEWDITNDEHFKKAKVWAREADHTHLASVQVDDTCSERRRAWKRAGYQVRCQPNGMGTPSCRRRKSHRRKDIYPGGLCTRKQWRVPRDAFLGVLW